MEQIQEDALGHFSKYVKRKAEIQLEIQGGDYLPSGDSLFVDRTPKRDRNCFLFGRMFRVDSYECEHGQIEAKEVLDIFPVDLLQYSPNENHLLVCR